MANSPAGGAPAPVRETGVGTAPLVLLGGGVTITLSLVGVWLAHGAGENVMGWYANYVIPAGAILVGLVASSGFGVASYYLGTKITGKLLLGVVLMLLAGYWLAQYVQFRLAFPDGATLPDGESAGFLDYYDAVTRSFAWVDHGKPGEPFGALGYLMRAGEILGFTGGGVLIPFLLRNLPYCDGCRAYMKSPVVARIPAGVLLEKINPKKKPDAARAQEERAGQALREAEEKLQAVRTAAAKDALALEEAIAAHGPPGAKGVDKLSARIWVQLVHCRRCAQGELRADLVVGEGKEMKRTALARDPLAREVVASFLKLPGQRRAG